MIDILARQTFWLTDTIKVERLEIAKPFISDEVVIGIDPGTVHLGVAYCAEQSYLYEVTLRRQEEPYQRIKDIQNIIGMLQMDDWVIGPETILVIEGASFADRYRQTELAEVRTAVATWLGRLVGQVSFVPPTTVMKKVFGKGNLSAWKVWTNLPPNAASALACAVYWNE